MKNIIDEQKNSERLADLTDKLLSGVELRKEEQEEIDALMAIVETIQDNTKDSTPSPQFAKNLRKMVLNELPVQKPELSERVQKVLAKLLGEEDFRKNFFLSPEDTLFKAGFQLTTAEIAALIEMTSEDQKEWFSDLDERISKSGLPGADL